MIDKSSLGVCNIRQSIRNISVMYDRLGVYVKEAQEEREHLGVEYV